MVAAPAQTPLSPNGMNGRKFVRWKWRKAAAEKKRSTAILIPTSTLLKRLDSLAPMRWIKTVVTATMTMPTPVGSCGKKKGQIVAEADGHGGPADNVREQPHPADEEAREIRDCLAGEDV